MKYAFVTGANRGLGYGFVEYLLDEGYFVFGGTKKLSREGGNNLMWIPLDVTDDVSIERAKKLVSEKCSGINVLINNAGVNKDTIPEGDKNLVSKLGRLDRNALLNMFNINSVSPIIVTQKFLPLLSPDPSFVINISSGRASFHDGHGGSTANYGYTASKVALNMMTFCSEVDLPKNVKTFAVHPGSVKTEMNPDGSDDPKTQASKIMMITKNWKADFNGKFMRYDGSLYPL